MKIEPNKQFPHSEPIVAALANSYDIELLNYREASSGIENTTLIVKGSESTYVFRIYRQDKKTNGQIQAELDFMAYLRRDGIPIPKIIPNNQGQSVTIFPTPEYTWQAIAMEFIAGKHVGLPSAKLLADMAGIQARMHLLAAKYVAPTENICLIKELVENQFIQQIDRSVLGAELQGFVQRGSQYKLALNDRLDRNLPTGPCHFDYHKQNILCHDGVITAVLDFDDLSVAPYVVCLAFALWHVYDQLGVTAMRTYLEHYERLRPIEDQEKDILYPAVLFRHYMITAIKILDGQTSPDDIQSYLQTENYLLSASITIE